MYDCNFVNCQLSVIAMALGTLRNTRFTPQQCEIDSNSLYYDELGNGSLLYSCATNVTVAYYVCFAHNLFLLLLFACLFVVYLVSVDTGT